MIEIVTEQHRDEYQQFIHACSNANYCHDMGWRDVFSGAYKKEPYYLIFRDKNSGSVMGIAPSFFIKSKIFGNHLVSMPYLDFGGVVAANGDVEQALLLDLVRKAKGCALELRCQHPITKLATVKNEKVTMILKLEGYSEESYWKGLNAKVRNQVRKADKSNVSIKWGRGELLDDFYKVFCINMRDLGSPVHSKLFFKLVLKHFSGAQIGVAYRTNQPIGGLVRIHWNNTLAIPWASTLRAQRVHCPNNALYWQSIQYAFQNLCKEVDFGRSSKGEGTYKFKKQWKADESPLAWYQFNKDGVLQTQVSNVASGKMQVAAGIWQKMPLWAANIVGPLVRPSISA